MIDFLGISFIIFLAVISPGPDFAIVARNALCYSQKIGVITSLGIAASTLFHASYCTLGFGLIIANSLLAFNIIKYVGAAYLIYLGLKGLLGKSSKNLIFSSVQNNKSITVFQAFRQGLLCNALNPKTILFFHALFTLMIKPEMPMYIQISYAIEIALIHFLWFSLISLAFSA